jgi:uncharacterized membrane protein YkvA (DUF1232 family)
VKRLPGRTARLSTLPELLKAWKTRVRALKTEIHALLIAARDPRTPWAAKALALLVVIYAASPIDLIPDFIPILGYLDDLLLLPLGIILAIRLIPPAVLNEARQTVSQSQGRISSWAGIALIVFIWLVGLGLLVGGVLYLLK